MQVVLDQYNFTSCFAIMLFMCVFPALGGTADVESIQLMMKEEEEKEKAFLERLAQKLKDGGVRITTCSSLLAKLVRAVVCLLNVISRQRSAHIISVAIVNKDLKTWRNVSTLNLKN